MIRRVSKKKRVTTLNLVEMLKLRSHEVRRAENLG